MNLPKFKNYVGQPVRYIQKKLDGHMMHVHVDKVGSITILSKNDKDKTMKVLGIPHIAREILRLPYATECFAELHCPDVPASSVPTMLNDGDERLQLSVFACPTLDGENLVHKSLLLVMDELRRLGLDDVPVTTRVLGLSSLTQCEKDSWLQYAITHKFEGWVLKEQHMEGWYKLKPVKTIDAVVVGYTVSDSLTYKGCLKAVKLEVEGHDLGLCGGGFTKEFKLSICNQDKFDELMYRVCEVEYQSVTVHKKLQFPRFIRWRPDKDATQCLLEQLS